MGEYLRLVNHTREEVITPSKIDRGLKMYQWMSECTSSIGVYLLLNTAYADKQEFAGLWTGDNIELVGDTKNLNYIQNYTDITKPVFEEMETNLEDFPENMDSEFAKQVLSAYRD